MKSSKAHSYYERYFDAVHKYGYRTVSLCDKTPSARSINAEGRIATEFYRKGGYLFQHNGDTYFVIHTPTGRDMMLVKED